MHYFQFQFRLLLLLVFVKIAKLGGISITGLFTCALHELNKLFVSVVCWLLVCLLSVQLPLPY